MTISPARAATVQGQTYWSDGTTAPKSGPSGQPAISAKATGANPSMIYVLITAKGGCQTDVAEASAYVWPDANGNIPVTNGNVRSGPYDRPDGTYDVCFAAVNGYTYTPVTAPISFTVGGAQTTTTTAPATTTTTAPSPDVEGQTYWSDGTTSPKSGPSGTPSVSAYATGARAGYVYVLISGKGGCLTDVRENSAYVTAAADGSIPVTSGTIRDGQNPRPDGTYDVCFAAVNGYTYKPVTRPLSFTVGGSTTTTTLATTTTTTAPTTTTTTAPVGGTCNISPANSASAVQAAIASCPNGTASAPTVVKFPAAASYSINGTILVDQRSHVTIDGNGSTFTSTVANTTNTTNHVWVLRLGTNVRLKNAKIEGQFRPTFSRTSDEALNTVRNTNQYHSAVAIYGGAGIWVEDVTANHIWGDGVLVTHSDSVFPSNPSLGSQSTDVHVLRLKATTHSRQCVAPTSVNGFWVEDSTCINSYYGGVDFEVDPGTPAQNIRNAHALRNTFDGYWGYAVAVAYDSDTGQVDGVEIRGNKTLTEPDTCYAPILTVYKEPGAVETPQSTVANIVVADNTLRTQGDGVSMRDVSSGSVTGNHITLTKGLHWCNSPSVPVRLINSASVTVSGNTAVGY